MSNMHLHYSYAYAYTLFISLSYLMIDILFSSSLFLSKMKRIVEAPGIDPGTSRMLSERSTI